jgi:hypothetical protein
MDLQLYTLNCQCDLLSKATLASTFFNEFI